MNTRFYRPFVLGAFAFMILGCESESNLFEPEVMFAKVPRLLVDQSNGLPAGPISQGLCCSNFGQTFKPKADNLARVDLGLSTNNFVPEGVDVTISIHKGSILDPVIATATAFVPGTSGNSGPRIHSFVLDSPVPLEKKAVYTVSLGPVVVPTGGTVSWRFSVADYLDGSAVFSNGNPYSDDRDFVFETFYLKPFGKKE